MRNGAHTIVLTVTDSRTPATGATTQITLNVDNIIAASFTSPANGATVSGIVPVNMAVTGNTSTWGHTFGLKVDGTVLQAPTYVAGTTSSYSWNTTTLANGAHTLVMTVTDGVGKSATATINATVAN